MDIAKEVNAYVADFLKVNQASGQPQLDQPVPAPECTSSHLNLESKMNAILEKIRVMQLASLNLTIDKLADPEEKTKLKVVAEKFSSKELDAEDTTLATELDSRFVQVQFHAFDSFIN